MTYYATSTQSHNLCPLNGQKIYQLIAGFLKLFHPINIELSAAFNTLLTPCCTQTPLGHICLQIEAASTSVCTERLRTSKDKVTWQKELVRCGMFRIYPFLQTQASVLHEALFHAVFWKGLGRTRAGTHTTLQQKPAVHQTFIISWSCYQVFLLKLVLYTASCFLLCGAQTLTRPTLLLLHRRQCSNAQHNLPALEFVLYVLSPNSPRRNWHKQGACILPRYLFTQA